MATPSRAWQRVSSRLSIPSAASSIRWQTASSTSAAVAPGKGTRTSTERAGMSGNVSRLTVGANARPTTRKATIIRLAAVG